MRLSLFTLYIFLLTREIYCVLIRLCMASRSTKLMHYSLHGLLARNVGAWPNNLLFWWGTIEGTEIPGMDLETKMKKTDCYISVTPPKISIAFSASQRPSHPIYNHRLEMQGGGGGGNEKSSKRAHFFPRKSCNHPDNSHFTFNPFTSDLFYWDIYQNFLFCFFYCM